MKRAQKAVHKGGPSGGMDYQQMHKRNWTISALSQTFKTCELQNDIGSFLKVKKKALCLLPITNSETEAHSIENKSETETFPSITQKPGVKYSQTCANGHLL